MFLQAKNKRWHVAVGHGWESDQQPLTYQPPYPSIFYLYLTQKKCVFVYINLRFILVYFLQRQQSKQPITRDYDVERKSVHETMKEVFQSAPLGFHLQ